VAYVRTVKTSSGATAVQIVWSSRRGSRSIEHLGSAHDEDALAALKAAAGQRLAAGQAELDLGVAVRSGSEPLPITSSRAAHPWEAMCRAYQVLGFDKATGGDEVFCQLVCARNIEPTRKADSLRVLAETGVAAALYPTLNRRLPVFAKPTFRRALSRACARHARLGPASLVLYDVSTLLCRRRHNRVYTTNLTDQTAQFVIDAYHQLWRIEKSFRMSKHDLQAWPIYHHTRESIEAHLSIVFAALAVSHWIERQTGWSIKKFVRTARRYRTVKIQAGRQTLTAAEPLPDDLAEALTKIRGSGAH
jgi:hypothetical protein